MIKKPNSKGLTHDQVKSILEKSDLNWKEVKPPFWERKDFIHFIIVHEKEKFKLRVMPKKIQYSRINQGWVFWVPIIVYSILHAAFRATPLVFLGILGFTYLTSMAMENTELKVIAADLDELINENKEYKEPIN
jgi:hypothetical protein